MRLGLCSKSPNASRAHTPTNNSRPITRQVDRVGKAGLMSRPASVDPPTTTSIRRQPNVRARPVGLGGATGGDGMVADRARGGGRVQSMAVVPAPAQTAPDAAR